MSLPFHPLTRLLLAACVAAVVLPDAARANGAAEDAAVRFLAVNSRGTAQNESADPNRKVFTFELYSLADGSRVGTAVDDVACSTTKPPPCAVVDARTTFHLPDGDLVNRADVSVAPDPQNPGWVIVSATGERSIAGGSGIYRGRTGSVRVHGTNDLRQFPNQMTQDDFWLIQLDRR
jgi:hypothetical protein